MPRKRRSNLPLYCTEEKDRRNPEKVYVYFRRPGQKKVPLHGVAWTPSFMAEYAAAMAAFEAVKNGTAAPESKPGEAPSTKIKAATPGTWRWLCERYIGSEEFKQLTGSTPATRRRILESTWTEPYEPKKGTLVSGLIYGDVPISKMTPAKVRELRNRKAKFKTAANDRRKIMGYVFAWGMENHPDLVLTNPVRDVARLKHTVRNVPPWTLEDFHRFMAKYPAGSKERRAMALHLYTGARGCDVRHFGPQHVKDGRFAFTQQKTGGEVDVPVLDELAEELALAPKDALAFILTERGKTFSEKGYSQWFNDKCRKAGLVDRTMHGIRSGAATIAANNGASVHQLMAIFGWLSESMAIRYTKAANRKRLADTGMPLIKLEQNEV